MLRQNKVIETRSVTHILGNDTVVNIDPSNNGVIDNIVYGTANLADVVKDIRVIWKRPGTLRKNDQFLPWATDKSVKNLVELVRFLREEGGNNSYEFIADSVDKSPSHVKRIYFISKFPNYVIEDMHFHNPIHKKGYTPPNKEYPFRYMSMTHARGLRIGRLNLNKTQFKKFYTRYKKTLPSTVDCVKHAEAIVNSII